MKNKKIITLCIFVSLILTLTACSKEAAPSEKEDLTEISLVLDWTPNTNHTGLFVAEEKGFFEEEGLSVNIVQPPEDGAVTLVASGKAPFGIGFQDTMADAWGNENPLPVTAIGAIINHNTSGIISEKSKDITSPKKMENHNYATWNSPIELAILESVVNSDGGNFNNIELIPSTITDVITALETDIDSVWVYYGWDGIASEVKELETNYFSFIDIDPIFDFYSPIILGNDSYLEEHPEETKAFMRAVAKGYEYAIENPEESAKILCALNPELDTELIENSQIWLADKYQGDAPQWGIIEPERWNGFYQWLADNDLTEFPIPKDFGFTNEYLPK